jgi:hypothetical protein
MANPAAKLADRRATIPDLMATFFHWRWADPQSELTLAFAQMAGMIPRRRSYRLRDTSRYTASMKVSLEP